MSITSYGSSNASFLTTTKEELAKRYWEVSRAFGRQPDSVSLHVGTMVHEMTDIAGQSQYNWGRLENMAARRLDDIIRMRRSRKTTATAAESSKVVALLPALAQALVQVQV